MKSPLACSLIALVLLGSSPSIHVEAQRADSEYLALLTSYARGATRESVATLVAWPDTRVRTAIRTLDSAAARDRARAGAMLHTEAAFVILQSDACAASDTQDRVRFQVDMARGFMSRLKGNTARAFEGRWHGLIALLFAMCDEPQRAQQEVSLGLSLDSKNADVRMAMGVLLEEGFLNGRWRELSADQVYGWILEDHHDFLEARLRLGWLESHSRLTARTGRKDLEAVAAATKRPDLQSLAHLFLADLEGRENRPDAAARELETAHGISPSQSSYVALIRSETALGHTERARALAADFAARPASAQEDDAWVRFASGITSGELLEWLRDEAKAR